MGFLREFTMIKETNFTIDCLKDCINYRVLQHQKNTPYHPMGDGQTERMNRTILNMLKTLEEKEKHDWKNHLSKLTFAYNSTIHKTTGYSPCYLMFGRSPRLPIDSIFDLEPDVDEEQKMQIPYKKYVEEWKRGMNQAFDIAKTYSRKSGESNRNY